MKILIAEDDPVLGQALLAHLSRIGYEAALVAIGADAEHRLAVERFELVVLDLGLPGMDGFEILRRVRQRGDRIPVLIVTARDELDDRVRGLERGADDYLCKPFEMAELVARIKALLRRAHGYERDEIVIGTLRLNVEARRVSVASESIALSARELAVLETLMLREGHVVSKDDILQRVYESEASVGENAVEVFMHRIRRKIAGSGVAIRTVRGLGYLLEQAKDAQA